MIELPWPAKPLWPNFRSRTHWAKTRATKKARADACWATKAARVGVAAGDVPIMLQSTFYPPAGRGHLPDHDNCIAAAKALFDGLADAWGVNDSAFRHLPPVIGEKVKGGRVTVEIVK